MQITPQYRWGWITEHDDNIRRYLAEHESEWRSRTGIARFIARVRLEFRAWEFAAGELQCDEYDPHKLY